MAFFRSESPPRRREIPVPVMKSPATQTNSIQHQIQREQQYQNSQNQYHTQQQTQYHTQQQQQNQYRTQQQQQNQYQIEQQQQNQYQNGNGQVEQAPAPVQAKWPPNIKVHGQALYIGSPRYPNTFYMDVGDDVDVTQISCMLQGQGQPEAWTNNKGNGRIEVSYRIGLIGKYKMHITYQGQHIEGSPFNITMR